MKVALLITVVGIAAVLVSALLFSGPDSTGPEPVSDPSAVEAGPPGSAPEGLPTLEPKSEASPEESPAPTHEDPAREADSGQAGETEAKEAKPTPKESEYVLYRRRIMRASVEELEARPDVNPSGRKLTGEERDLLASMRREMGERIRLAEKARGDIRHSITRAQLAEGNYTLQDPLPEHKFGKPPPEYDGQVVFAAWVGGKVKVVRIDLRDYPELKEVMDHEEEELDYYMQSVIGFFR